MQIDIERAGEQQKSEESIEQQRFEVELPQRLPQSRANAGVQKHRIGQPEHQRCRQGDDEQPRIPRKPEQVIIGVGEAGAQYQ